MQARWLAAAVLALPSAAQTAPPPSPSPATFPATSPTTPPSASRPIPDTLAQRALPCTSCHQADDRQTADDGYIPRIAGKPAGYLLEQMRHFRDGRRSHAGMAHLMAPLDDRFLGELAAHFASLPAAAYRLPTATAAPGAGAAQATADADRRAAAWITQGDPARQIPACTACHGATLTGVAPAVPGLLGLPPAYVSAQLGAWRQGLRRARVPDCMALIAKALPLEDVAVIARWLASRPPPADPRPAAAPPGAWPLECGSTLK